MHFFLQSLLTDDAEKMKLDFPQACLMQGSGKALCLENHKEIFHRCDVWCNFVHQSSILKSKKSYFGTPLMLPMATAIDFCRRHFQEVS